MKPETAHLLTRLTSEFYAQTAASFSATRQAPWAGWQGVLDVTGLASREALRVLDLACGNLRFERFLAERLACTSPEASIRVHAFDSCDELAAHHVPPEVELSYTHLDVIEALDAGALAEHVGTGDYDLAVCFGFMHHLPLVEQRVRVLEALVASVADGGFVAVSFWQLSHSERLLAKAQATTKAAAPALGIDDLGPGDYLLGWQERSDVLRYCHDFSEEEISALVAGLDGVRELARFSADGATGNLNRYLILQRT